MDALTEFIVGFVILVLTCLTCLVLGLKIDSFIPSLTVLGIGGVISIILAVSASNDLSAEEKAKELQEKIKIDSLSCKALGNYIIHNASNSTEDSFGYMDKSYKYAQAKFLVCTHTPLGSSP